MSPDEEYEQYYMTHENGNHPEGEPAGETLRYMEKQNEINKETGKTFTEIKLTLGRIESKLDYTNGKVGEHEKFVTTYEPALQALVEDQQNRKEKKKAWYDVSPTLVVTVMGGLILAYLVNKFGL